MKKLIIFVIAIISLTGCMSLKEARMDALREEVKKESKVKDYTKEINALKKELEKKQSNTYYFQDETEITINTQITIKKKPKQSIKK